MAWLDLTHGSTCDPAKHVVLEAWGAGVTRALREGRVRCSRNAFTLQLKEHDAYHPGT
ncbi:MAG TPA: hypothetical protein VN680_11670 [Burkholderiaceae bacterium]|nr:hypothetical protein [Burkholderiaceae bacterium]